VYSVQKKSLCFLLVLLTLVGCDRLWAIKRRVRTAIMGESVEDALESEEGSYADEGTEESSDSPIIAESTPRKRLFNLMREHQISNDTSFVPIILQQIPIVASDIGKELDEDLLSSILRYASKIEVKNEKAVEVVAEWYKVLSGENKNEVGKVLGTVFDFYLKEFFKNYTQLMQKDGCKLSILLPGRVKGDNSAETYLKSRRIKLDRLINEGIIQGFSRTVGQQCLSRMDTRIRLYQNSTSSGL
jgi:hypothetical protein